MRSSAAAEDSGVTWKSTSNSAIAGYSAGFVGVVLGHPLDSLKVWAQTASTGKNRHLVPTGSASQSGAGSFTSNNSIPASRAMSTMASEMTTRAAMLSSSGTWSRIRSSPVARTVRALYSGASVPLFTVGIVQSINFATYDATRRTLHRAQHPNAKSEDYLHSDSLFNVAIAGFVAGTGLAFVTSPLIMIKTSQQVTGNSFRQAFRETLLPHGRLNLSGCFVGIYPHLASETLGRALYYTVYEACKRQAVAYKHEQGLEPATVSLSECMGAAALAGVLCWSAIYPLDVLRNRMYSQAGRTNNAMARAASTMEMARTLYQEGAMYRGFSLTVLRAGPVAAMVLPIYDMTLEYLSTTSS